MRTPREGLFTARVRLRVLALDTTDPDSIAAAIEAAGPIGVLVNDAGIGILSAVAGIYMARARETFETNTLGTVAMTKAVPPGFRRRRSSVIVNVVSGTTMALFPFLFFYTAIRAAIVTFSDCLALEPKKARRHRETRHSRADRVALCRKRTITQPGRRSSRLPR